MTGRWRAARPTRRAALIVGLVALATVALPVGVVAPLLVTAAVAGCVLVDLVVAGRARVHGTRTKVNALSLRVPVDFEVEAETSSSVHPDRIRQPVPAELAVEPDEHPGRRLDGELLGRHRGVHELPGAICRVTGPLGLASCDHIVTDGQSITVLPVLP